MSVLLEFAMFPTDKGETVSQYVSKIIKMIAESGYSYQLTSMGTIVETDTIKEALELIENSYKVLEPFSKRIYTTLKMDIRAGQSNRIKTKIESIEKQIGKVNK